MTHENKLAMNWDQHLAESKAKAKRETELIEKITQGVAKYLKQSVLPKRNEEDWQNRIRLDMGASIYISWSDHKRTHVSVSGSFPQNHEGHTYRPQSYDKLEYASIKVSCNKTPERIGKDIETRFLPNYLKAYSEMNQRASSSDLYYNNSIQAAQAVATFCKADLDKDYNSKKKHPKFNITIVSTSFEDSSVHVEAHGAKVKMDISYVTAEMAIKIIHLIKTETN